MELIFLGNTEFSVPSARAIRSSGHRIAAVVTYGDRPQGRGQVESPTPVKDWALEESLEIIEVDDNGMKGLLHRLGSMKWEVGVVVAFGKRVPKALLDMPSEGFVNLHPSLLPRYRGAAPIQRAIMDGANLTGVTTIRMSEEIDAGPILLHREEEILLEDTVRTLEERLSRVGAKLLVETLNAIETESVRLSPQENNKATYAPLLTKGECEVDWSRSSDKVRDLVRALNPSPGAYTHFRGKRVKVWSCGLTDVPSEDEPGTLMGLGKENLLVCTGTDCVQIERIQLEGKGRVSGGEFSRGQRILVGERFLREGQE